MFTYNGIKVAGLVIIIAGLFGVYKIEQDLVLIIAKWILVYYLFETFIILKYLKVTQLLINTATKKSKTKQDFIKETENKLVKLKADIAKAKTISEEVNKVLEFAKQHDLNEKEKNNGGYNH